MEDRVPMVHRLIVLTGDPGRGEAGVPADPRGALQGGMGKCRQQLGLEILWPCTHSGILYCFEMLHTMLWS
uniref:Uncharacterized protein n=1 Tax=Setaria viridis TaxID=4556 RepID=A0A4U6TPD0_SETVI|nr:hypothetical protein SEVIR_7G003905v2 [Setaria viridis]